MLPLKIFWEDTKHYKNQPKETIHTYIYLVVPFVVIMFV